MKTKQLFLFLGALIGLELVSFLTIDHPIVSGVVAVLLTLLVAILTWKNLTYGVYALLVELVLGGKGYLFSLTILHTRLSWRILLFVAVLGIWLVRFLIKKEKMADLRNLFGALWWPYITLLVALGGSIAIGLVRGNSGGAVFLDANAFGYFLLAPVFFEGLKLPENKKRAIQIWLAAAFWLAVKTIILFVIFNTFGRDMMDYLYRWVRNSGVGEVTWLSSVRVFLQSQIFIVAAFLYILCDHRGEKIKKMAPIMILFGGALLFSESRSFFVGLAGTVVAIGVYYLWQRQFTEFKKMLQLLLVASAGAYILVLLLSGNIFSPRERLALDPGESSRHNQLPVLLRAIKQNPLGYGFGQTLTYQTTDPRALVINPSGHYATYSFELGWLDFTLKTGLWGLFIYGWLLWAILRRIWPQMRLVAPLLALVAIHAVTPYLNHPLGIGLLLLVAALTI